MMSSAVHTTLKGWLESLRLTEYLDAFTRNNFTDIEKLRKVWEVELTTVCMDCCHVLCRHKLIRKP